MFSPIQHDHRSVEVLNAISLLQDAMEIYYMKGAPERVLQQCTSYYKQGFNVPIGAKDGELFADAVAAMSSRGLRGTVWRGRRVSTVFNLPPFDHPTPQDV